MNARLFSSTLVLAALGYGCSAPSLSVIPRFQQATFSGDIAANSNPAQISATTSFDDLNLDDDNVEFAPRLDLVFGGHLSISHLASDFTGVDGSVNAEFEFEGNTINANTGDVDTDLEMSATNAAITWDVVPGDFEAGIGLGATLINADLALASGANLVEFDSLEDIPMPLLALRLGWSNDLIQVGALISGLELSADTFDSDPDTDIDVSVFDYDLHAGFKIFDGLKLRGLIVAGYRNFEIDAQGSDGGEEVLLDIEFGGPYLGVTLEI